MTLSHGGQPSPWGLSPPGPAAVTGTNREPQPEHCLDGGHQVSIQPHPSSAHELWGDPHQQEPLPLPRRPSPSPDHHAKWVLARLTLRAGLLFFQGLATAKALRAALPQLRWHGLAECPPCGPRGGQGPWLRMGAGLARETASCWASASGSLVSAHRRAPQ